MRHSLGNHLGKQGSSIIEIIAMMTILGIAVTAMFSTVIGAIHFSKNSENRIKAINLAREGIEGVTNLRNTNWLRFSSDQVNCWRILDYQSSCIGNALLPSSYFIGTSPLATSYVLENKNGAWYLTGTTSGSGLWVDERGFYFSSGTSPGDAKCTFTKATNCRSPFSREVRIMLPSGNSGSMTVTSVVDWNEQYNQNVTIQTTLTNWRSKF